VSVKDIDARVLCKVMCKQSSGFLLAELTVLLALCALLFGIGVPAFSCLDKAVVRGEVERLATAVQCLQGHAIATGKVHKLVLADHRLAPTVHMAKSTFPENTIVCNPSGVVCAGTVYLVDVQRRFAYSLAMPVGGYYRYINEQNCPLSP
jgi:uncharacterized membrane protein YgdD (TMEM256/DUF423 family)